MGGGDERFIRDDLKKRKEATSAFRQLSNKRANNVQWYSHLWCRDRHRHSQRRTLEMVGHDRQHHDAHDRKSRPTNGVAHVSCL